MERINLKQARRTLREARAIKQFIKDYRKAQAENFGAPVFDKEPGEMLGLAKTRVQVARQARDKARMAVQSTDEPVDLIEPGETA